jgi:hypothetical protein
MGRARRPTSIDERPARGQHSRAVDPDEREAPPGPLPAEEIVVVPPRGPGPSERSGNGGNGPRGLGWVPWAALVAGLGLSLLLTRHGFFFFFLPIIVPFGLGGGSWLKRWGKRGRRE